MNPPYANRLDRINAEIKDKYGSKQGNPTGHNRYTKKAELVKSIPKEVLTDTQRIELSMRLYQSALKFNRLGRKCMSRWRILTLKDDISEARELTDEQLIQMAERL